MASGMMRDITPGIVQILAHDKDESPAFSADTWTRTRHDRPTYARYIEARIRAAFPDDENAQGRALDILIEVTSLDERVVFADFMRSELGESAPSLGGLALAGDGISPDIVPLADIDFGPDEAA